MDISRKISLYDFSTQEQLDQWKTINDTVMGGVSRSTVTPLEGGGICFSGTVSLDNFGGFCSAGSRSQSAHNLTGCDGITVCLKGDGKRYKLTLKNEAEFTGFSYQYVFETQPDRQIDMYAPFNEFIASFRGRALDNAAPVDPAHITSVGFLISDKQKGPFSLEVYSISGFEKANA